MALPNQHIRGIVTVMDDAHHRSRSTSLGAALERLSMARERRGSVGMLDPAALVQDELRATPALRHPSGRRGLFRFSEHARDAIDPSS